MIHAIKVGPEGESAMDELEINTRATAGASPHVSHDNGQSIYRQSEGRSDQRRVFADKINGIAGANSVPPHCPAYPSQSEAV